MLLLMSMNVPCMAYGKDRSGIVAMLLITVIGSVIIDIATAPWSAGQYNTEHLTENQTERAGAYGMSGHIPKIDNITRVSAQE